MNINPKDWALLRKRVPGWQEAYMDKLNHSYIDMLSGDGKPSDKFWELRRRIRDDKRSIGVVIDMRRSMMHDNLCRLLFEGVITEADLEGFSDELRESVLRVMQSARQRMEEDDPDEEGYS